MHALVTGGGGFLGGYIVEALLARGDRVRSFGRGDYPELAAQGVEVVRGDIRDRRRGGGRVPRHRLRVSCGGDAGHRHAIATRIDAVESRRHGACCWSTAARQGVARLVYTSSPSVVFAGDDQCGVDESAPYDFRLDGSEPGVLLAIRKRAPKQAVLAANGDELQHLCACGRISFGGRGDTHLIPRLIARARSGRLRRVGDGTNLVDITYVENAAEAHLLAADALARSPVAEATSPAGKAYFISQGEPVNCWQWIDEVLALVGFAAGDEVDVARDGVARWVQCARLRIGCCGSRASRR